MISKHNYAPLAGADTHERIALSGNTSHTNAFKKAASGQAVGEMLHSWIAYRPSKFGHKFHVPTRGRRDRARPANC